MPRGIAGPHQAHLEIDVPDVGAELLGREEPVHEHPVGFVEAARFGQRQRQLEADGRRHVCRVWVARERRRALGCRSASQAQSLVDPDVEPDVLRINVEPLAKDLECLVRPLERDHVGQAEVAMQTGNARVLAASRGPRLECRLDPPAREIERAEKKAGGGVGRVALQGRPQYRKRLRTIGKDVGRRLASGGMEIAHPPAARHAADCTPGQYATSGLAEAAGMPGSVTTAGPDGSGRASSSAASAKKPSAR